MKIRVRYRHNAGEVKQDVTRAFSIGLTLLAMFSVALLSALFTMRLAIHASEVEVPNLGGLTLDEASNQTHEASLNLTVENRFYSTTVPAGRVLSQSPAVGMRVRKGWHMRVTESMGPQRVPIPDTVGMNERDAAMVVRRASFDLGTLAHLPAPGPPDIVLAQTPPANAEGVDKPEVSLLLSQPIESAPKAYVMPNLVGLSFSAARARMKEMKLPLYAIIPQPPPPPANPDPTAPPPPPPVLTPAGPIATQVPVAGSRVSAAENPHVFMTKGYYAIASPRPALAPTPAAPPAKPPVSTPGRPASAPSGNANSGSRPAAPIVRQAPVAEAPLFRR